MIGIKKTGQSLLIIIFVGIMFCWIVAQEQGDPDSWEIYHNLRQPPEKVMDAIGVKPGMAIGEIGAGRGRYAVKLAARVGITGKIYANDILEKKLEYLKYRCRRDNIPNLITVLGELTKPNFPKETLDMVFIINTYHHIDKQVELLKNTVSSLRPDGTLVIVECEPGKAPQMGSHSTEKEVLIKQVESAGYSLIQIETFLSMDNIYIFRLKNSK